MGRPVSLANCSLMWRVGLGVWEKAVLRISSCFALMVVRGPRRFDPADESSGDLFSAPGSRDSESPSIDPWRRKKGISVQLSQPQIPSLIRRRADGFILFNFISSLLSPPPPPTHYPHFPPTFSSSSSTWSEEELRRLCFVFYLRLSRFRPYLDCCCPLRR